MSGVSLGKKFAKVHFEIEAPCVIHSQCLTLQEPANAPHILPMLNTTRGGLTESTAAGEFVLEYKCSSRYPRKSKPDKDREYELNDESIIVKTYL